MKDLDPNIVKELKNLGYYVTPIKSSRMDILKESREYFRHKSNSVKYYRIKKYGTSMPSWMSDGIRRIDGQWDKIREYVAFSLTGSIRISHISPDCYSQANDLANKLIDLYFASLEVLEEKEWMMHVTKKED